MTKAEYSRLLPTTPLVVGTVHSNESLAAALKIRPLAIDVLELRVDAFAGDVKRLLAAAPRFDVPLIVTARHPAEGGANALSASRRRELYLQFLPHARFLDIELRSAGALADVIRAAREQGVHVILSSHDFKQTPALAALKRRAAQARAAGADIFKIATFTRTPGELARLVTFFAEHPKQSISAMGMGPYGKVSRILFARLGSLLNYGYLHRPNADGQWEARELKTRLREL